MTDQSTTPPPTIVNVHLDNTNYATAAAAATAQAAAVPAARKSALLAYLALAVGWLAGLHRFYLGKSPFRWVGFFWLVCWTVALISPTDSYALLIPVFAFPLIDAFLIPGWVRRHNGEREAALARVASSTTPPAAASAASAASAAPPGEAVAPPTDRPKDLRTRLLRAAHRGDGRLTVTQAVMETEAGFEEVERALHALVTAGHIDVDNDPDSGVVRYLFPELVGRPRLGDPPSH